MIIAGPVGLSREGMKGVIEFTERFSLQCCPRCVLGFVVTGVFCNSSSYSRLKFAGKS